MIPPPELINGHALVPVTLDQQLYSWLSLCLAQEGVQRLDLVPGSTTYRFRFDYNLQRRRSKYRDAPRQPWTRTLEGWLVQHINDIRLEGSDYQLHFYRNGQLRVQYASLHQPWYRLAWFRWRSQPEEPRTT